MNYAKSAHPYDFSSVRYVFCCNANLSNYTRKLWMENYGIKIYENYGKAEASSFLSFNTPMHNKSNSQGRFLPGIEYKIQEISFLKNAGRLFLKGANISPGYIIFNNQIQKIGGDEICRGWFDSGDIASIDSDEYLTIHGSIKRYIKINNEYISLYLVENVASQIDIESENSALFISSTESIVLFSTSQIIDNDLYKDYLIKNNYSLNLLPKIFKKLKYIPTTDSGEYSYQELLKVIEDF
jgi:acyl-[acyl-carrier-protein]-phospholipid O-acyltransferase/long-chain-fatty-acid--[acyl-carrier-protein] ligase